MPTLSKYYLVISMLCGDIEGLCLAFHGHKQSADLSYVRVSASARCGSFFRLAACPQGC